jgi:N-acetyl-1-D-myo-inositol-2-amino-2-deoxy-alpha-D-glucopyranoside deacetylase
MTDLPDRRLLFVHAHPDDETINNGATMAKYAAEGALVTLVTCTLGEEGEVIPPDLAPLAADREDRLGPHRIGELAAAMRALGVVDHRFLGGAGRYRDSGMMGVPQNEVPGCFWQADLDEAAGHLADVILEVRPQALVTYDDNGGYGHPDHIQAHRVAMRGYELAAGRGHRVDRVYEICMPRSAVEAGFERLAAAGKTFPFEFIATPDDVPGVVDDDKVTVTVDGSAYTDRKKAAMHAHASQIAVDGPFFALSNDLGQPYFGTEYYHQVHGEPPADPHDLLGGDHGEASGDPSGEASGDAASARSAR